MKMKIVLIISLLILVGCSSEFKAHQIRKISELCGGMENISSMWKVGVSARGYCMDGKIVPK